MVDANNTPLTKHGRDVFNTHWNCDCEGCEPIRNAVKRLVDSFSAMPTHWLGLLSEHPSMEGERLSLPMWGTLFLPTNSADISNIEVLLREIEPEDGDYEEEAFAYSGWKEVANTGIYAIEFDGDLLLGIHGAGYDFYTEHWWKLYDALGYHWHE